MPPSTTEKTSTLDDSLTRKQPEATLETPVPAGTRSYIGYYLQGNLAPLTKNFYLSGTLRDAVERWRAHCTKMGYRPLRVRPFFVDLDRQEEMKSKRDDYNDDLYE